MEFPSHHYNIPMPTTVRQNNWKIVSQILHYARDVRDTVGKFADTYCLQIYAVTALLKSHSEHHAVFLRASISSSPQWWNQNSQQLKIQVE